MKGFGIEIKNNLLEQKHLEHMNVAVWLYMWFLDKMTSVNEDGLGKVLGGKPIKYKDIQKDFGIDERKYQRWIATLRKGGYINTIRTPYGLSVTVNKAFKRFGRKTDTTKMSGEIRQKRPISATKMSDVIKTITVDNNRETTNFVKNPQNEERIRELKADLKRRFTRV